MSDVMNEVFERKKEENNFRQQTAHHLRVSNRLLKSKQVFGRVEMLCVVTYFGLEYFRKILWATKPRVEKTPKIASP